MWQNYVYTGDEKFLAEEAYPTLKESAEFLLDQLVEHPKYGWLVTGPSASPENAFIAPDGVRSHASMGPTCDVVLIRQLFASCMEAGKILGVDEGFRETLKQAQTRLPPLQIGKHGQLQEWLEDYDEAIPGHRHMAHMLAVYPFGLISPEATPALATAAKTTIERRLGAPKFEDHGWSRALAFVCLARLGCGEDAYRQLQTYMGKFLHNNLLDFAWGGHTGTRYPIFCLDGNGGAAAGVAEMLMQDRSGVIALLPALPSAWPTGHVKGLCAPGGFEVDQYWREGVLERAVIRAKRGGRCQVAAQTPLHVESRNQPVPCETTARGTIRFQAAPGETYVLRAYPNVPGRSQSRLGL
jgi:alpha-L-fucosidase 2